MTSEVDDKRTRDRYAELFDFAPVAYVVLDRHGVVKDANRAAAQLLGMARAELIGRSLTGYVHPEQAAIGHLSNCRQGDPRVLTEVVLHAKDGAATPVLLISSPSSPPSSDALFHTAIVDLRECPRTEQERTRIGEEQQRRLHDEQVARSASEAKDRFLAMLSHELRGPLTPILFALESVKSRAIVPEALEPTLDMIRRNVLLETRLIDDLLDMTRIVQEKMSLLPEIVDAHDLINDVVILYREQLQEADVTLTIDAAAAAHHVHADPVRVRQVLWNLLNNAVRNSAPGGQVTVRSTNRTPEWFTVTVTDAGRGIEPAMLSQIFTFFVQDEETRRRGIGLGLGLPISKAIIEAHGGRISAASEGRGRGATFTIELPTVAAEPATASAARQARTVPAQAKTVLLVEDNEDSAAAMAEFLRLHGYEVRIASTMREALDQVNGTDLLVSDIALPDGTGHDLMLQISAQRPIPGIALSGYGSADDAHRSAAAGFVRHIVKPVDPSELLGAIDELCGR